MGANFKIGSNSAGLFIGDKQILGGVENLLNEISIAPDFEGRDTTSMFVANLSTKELTLTRDDVVTTIPKQHIEWYSCSENMEVKILCNEPVYTIRAVYMYFNGGAAAYQTHVGTDVLPSIPYPQDDTGFYIVLIVMDNV